MKRTTKSIDERIINTIEEKHRGTIQKEARGTREGVGGGRGLLPAMHAMARGVRPLKSVASRSQPLRVIE